MMLLRNHIKQLGRVNFTRSTALFHSNVLKFNKSRSFCSFNSTNGKIENEIMNYKEPKLSEFIRILTTTKKNKKKNNLLESVNCGSFSILGGNILIWLENSEKKEKKDFLSTLVNLNIKKSNVTRSSLAFYVLKFIVEPEEPEKRDFLEILEILEEITLENEAKVLNNLFSINNSILIPYFKKINLEKQKLILEIFKENLKENEKQNSGILKFLTESLLKDIDEVNFIELCEEVHDFKSKNFINHFVANAEKYENLAKLPAFQTVLNLKVNELKK